MRAFALAATAVCFGLMLGGTASARPWSDPQGRVTFDAPAGWSTMVSRSADQSQFTYVISGTANNECQVAAVPNAATASHQPASVRAQGADPARFTNEIWAQSLNRFNTVFPDNSAQIESTSADTSGAWPIQRAEARSPERAVHAAMIFRPGVEIVVMCMTYDGADRTDLYDAFIRSIGHPNDATWGAAPAAAPAPAATP